MCGQFNIKNVRVRKRAACFLSRIICHYYISVRTTNKLDIRYDKIRVFKAVLRAVLKRFRQ